MAEGQFFDPEAAAPQGLDTNRLRVRWMFWIAFSNLGFLALMLPHGGADKPIQEMALYHVAIPILLIASWIAIICESVYGFRQAPDRKPALKRLILVVLLPAFRMVISPVRPNREVWLPAYGWREVSTVSVAEMEQRTAIPMLLATALIIPVLIVDFGLAEIVKESRPIQVTMAILMALIWFSFALEFIVMVSLAPKKLAYCKKHWINIVIIVLPLVAFLRSLQAFRFLRVAKAGNLARAYRLRGLLTRSLKIALAFNLIERIMSLSPERYIASLDEKILEKEEELADLRQRRDQTHARIAEREAKKAAAGKSDAASQAGEHG